MWKGNYGKEPFDLRLTLLRLGKNLHWMILCIIISTLVLGGVYCIKNIVFRPEKTYCAVSTFKIEFANSSWAQYGTYINETTWNTWIHTGEFLENVEKHLAEQGGEIVVSIDQLKEMLSAKLASDLRIPSTYVVTNQPQLSEAIARAVEMTMVQEFAQGVSDDIAKIRVIDEGKAEEVLWDVRPVRAYILSAIISVLFVFALYFLREMMDDSIWLPVLLNQRYGLPVIGSLESPECFTNLHYLLQGKNHVAICPADDTIDPMEVERALQLLVNENGQGKEPKRFLPMPAPILSLETCEKLREIEAVILVVRAGERQGKSLERLLEFLNTQEIQIHGALLWEADEKLIRNYYRLEFAKGKEKERA